MAYKFLEKELSREERFLVRHLLDVISSLLNEPRTRKQLEERVEAQTYLFVDDHSSSPVTFLNICLYFDINALKLRKQLIEALIGDKTNFNFLVKEEATVNISKHKAIAGHKSLRPVIKNKKELPHGRPKKDEPKKKEIESKKGKQKRKRKVSKV